jgi:hypothetical protein
MAAASYDGRRFQRRRNLAIVSMGFAPPRRRAEAWRPSDWKRTTILRQFARKLAESADASGRKIGYEKLDASRRMGYRLRFVRSLAFERRLLRM